MTAEKIQVLTPKQHVLQAVADDSPETAIAFFKEKYAGLKADTKENYELIKKGYTEAVTRRTSIEKRRLSLKKDVDAEAARLTLLLAPIELELKTEKDAYEAEEKARKAEAAAKKAAEEKIRIDKIKARIANFGSYLQNIMTKDAETLKSDLDFLTDCIDQDTFNYEEFINEAEKAKFETRTALNTAYVERKALEEREAAIKAKQEEMDKQQAVIDEANRIIAEKAAEDANKAQQEMIDSLPSDTIIEELETEIKEVFGENINVDSASNVQYFNKQSQEQQFLEDDSGNTATNIPLSDLNAIGDDEVRYDNRSDTIKTSKAIAINPYTTTEDILASIPSNEHFKIAANMQKFGGSFVKHLGAALGCADANNIQRIKNAFPDYWTQYENWGK